MTQRFESLEDFERFARAEQAVKGIDAVPKDVRLELQIADVMQETYVIEPVAAMGEGNDRFSGVITGDNLEVETEGGSAEVRRDPFSGNLLLKARDLDQVSAKAQLAGSGLSIVSDRTPVGISVDHIPVAQQTVHAAGGGACMSKLTAMNDLEIEVQVRASVQASVIPRTLDQREVSWRNGRYYSYNTDIGLMSLYYDPNRASKIVMNSPNNEDALKSGDFFPSPAKNEIHFICDFVDLGISTFSTTPMRQTISETKWPPFNNDVFHIDEPLEFYDVSDPSRLIMVLESQEMYLYDYNAIDVQFEGARYVGGGVTITRWHVANQSDEIVRARYFILGDVEKSAELPGEGALLLGPVKSRDAERTLDIPVRTHGSVLSQRMSLNVVSYRGEVLSGAREVLFQTDGKSGISVDH